MRKYLFGILAFTFAFAILSVSVLRSASPRYAFATPSEDTNPLNTDNKIVVDYELAYPGTILPDSPLWPLKALRDKLWHALTFDSSKEAELSLLCSDKRLGMSKSLFERGKPELAYSTLTKGEKYLEEALSHEEMARKKGENTTELLIKISNAALKHRLMIDEMLSLAPEDAKPGMIRTQDYSKIAFNKAAEALNAKGISVPKNPFDGD